MVASIITRLSLEAGLKQWGDRAYTAAHTEMKQLHMHDTFKPKHWHELTHLQKQMILKSHIFLKEKRCGIMKGQTVADRSKQHEYMSKEDASLLTVTTELVLYTCIIDAEEGWDITVIDILNAFIQTHIKDEKDIATIQLCGVIVDILLSIALDVYRSYITTDSKGNKQLIVQCQNALYGTMIASLLYYHKFVKSLTDIGFELNPYNPCVANKMIEGHQMTICFHVDNCKLSHKKSQCNDKMIKYLQKKYESVFEDGSGKMKVSHGMWSTPRWSIL